MGAIITKVGLAKIARATIEDPLVIEKFALGDGSGNEVIPNEDMTSLVNEKYRDLINDKYISNNNTVFESVLKANAPIEEGFYIRELGLFDEDGDLIVITDVPVQYRPITEEGNIVTELVFNVSIQVQNSEVIEVKINEQVFATQEALNRLLERVETLEQNKQDLLESSVGIEKWFNTENRYKDQDIVQIGVKTYALMDESNVLKISEYPMLYKNIKGVDRGDGSFAMPNFYDGTTRHLPKGSSRALGSYESDETKAHIHDINDIQGTFYSGYVGYINNKDWYTLDDFRSAFKSSGITSSKNYYNIFLDSNSTAPMLKVDFSSHAAGVTGTNSTGGEETRMKNTSGQWYVLAKVNV